MPPTALTIGNFDGVHAGHAALVRRAREMAGPDGRVIALSLDPHPASVLRPGSEPPRLTTFDQRERLLRAGGADEVVRLEPTPGLLAQTPEEFIAGVATRYRPTHIVEGGGFGFGKGRAGDADTLTRLGKVHGYETSILGPLQIALRDQTEVTASSTMVRWLLAHGRVRDAALVLGRPHELPGVVIAGDRRGRTIGFPTANIDTPCMIPAGGVYAGIAGLDDERVFAAAVNVGPRPTFDSTAPRVEAHLLDIETVIPPSRGLGPARFHETRPHPRTARAEARGSEKDWRPLPDLPEYGWSCTIELIAWVRDQVRFDSPERLADQLTRDCDRVRQILGPIGPTRTDHLEMIDA